MTIVQSDWFDQNLGRLHDLPTGIYNQTLSPRLRVGGVWYTRLMYARLSQCATVLMTEYSILAPQPVAMPILRRPSLKASINLALVRERLIYK